MWDNTIITDKGIELLKNALNGGTINVTAIKAGAGKVDVSALKSQTAVSEIKQSGTIQGVTTASDGTIKIGVLFSNTGLTAGYLMTQLGIYAKDASGTEVLFAISQNSTGKEVPSETSMPSWSLVHDFYIKLSNDVSITTTIDPEGYVTFGTLQEELEKQKIKDTGWITVNTFFNGCTHYGPNSKVMVRQYGDVVSIIGAIGNSKVLKTKSTSDGYPVVEMFKLPDEIEVPMEDIRFVQQGSGLNRFSLVINYNTRKVSIERYGTTSVIDVPVNQWLNVVCSYLVY